jgi:hypothetical protein
MAMGAFGLFAAFTVVICIYSWSAEPKFIDVVEASPDAQSMEVFISDVKVGDTALPITRTVSLQYIGINAPVAADVAIVSSDLNQTLTHSTTRVNLRQRASYSLELAIPAGAYAAIISAPDIKTKVMPFIVEGSQELISVKMGSFEPADSVS